MIEPTDEQGTRSMLAGGLVFDALALVGAGLVGLGCWYITPPLALVWFGGLLLTVGVAGALTKR